MNNKTNKWAVVIRSPVFSEAVQRIAFTFGYKWQKIGKEVAGVNHPFLIFSPDEQTFTYSLSQDRQCLEDFVCSVCNTLDQVIEMLKTPPKVKKVVDVGTFRIHEDGTVVVARTYQIDSKDFDEIVEARNKLMGKSQQLPVIRFRYHSPTSGSEARQVALVSEDKDYLSGLDLGDGNKFKQFRKDRLEIGGAIWFCGFKEV